MQLYEAQRCQHIKTNGTQCQSPALKDNQFCYYHQENRTLAAPLYLDGERYPDDHIKIPPLEDAYAIQKVLRQILLLMMERRIDRKDASLILYALQIASANLRPLQAEKPRATHVVCELEKVADTPIGMTPWALNGQGHEIEETAQVQREREVREIDESWRALYEQGLKMVHDFSQGICDWLQSKDGHSYDCARAWDFLGKMRDTIAETAQQMEKNLESRHPEAGM